MMTIEQLFVKTMTGRAALTKIIICGILTFVPIIFFLPFGYLFRFIKQCSVGNFVLPDWDDWSNILALFKDGVIFFVLLAVFYLIPIVLSFLVAELFFIIMSAMYLQHAAYLAYSLVGITLLLAPILLSYCIVIFLKNKQQYQCLLKIGTYRGLIDKNLFGMIVPSLSFNGLLILGLPFYGISFFLGLTILIPYYQLMLSQISPESE